MGQGEAGQGEAGQGEAGRGEAGVQAGLRGPSKPCLEPRARRSQCRRCTSHHSLLHPSLLHTDYSKTAHYSLLTTRCSIPSVPTGPHQTQRQGGQPGAVQQRRGSRWAGGGCTTAQREQGGQPRSVHCTKPQRKQVGTSEGGPGGRKKIGCTLVHGLRETGRGEGGTTGGTPPPATAAAQRKQVRRSEGQGHGSRGHRSLSKEEAMRFFDSHSVACCGSAGAAQAPHEAILITCPPSHPAPLAQAWPMTWTAWRTREARRRQGSAPDPLTCALPAALRAACRLLPCMSPCACLTSGASSLLRRELCIVQQALSWAPCAHHVSWHL